MNSEHSTGEKILTTILYNLRDYPKVYIRVLRTSWKKQNFIFLFSGNILDVPLEDNDWNFNRTTGDENEISLEISRFGKNPYLPPVIISPKA